MKLHLDTSFLIEWRRDSPLVIALRDEILRGEHDVSYDPIAETQFMSAFQRTRRHAIVMMAVRSIAARLPITPECSLLPADWLAPMDVPKRRAHFADAIIAACAATAGATLVTGDRRIGRVFPDARVIAY